MPLPVAVKSDVISQFRTAGNNLLAALNNYVTLSALGLLQPQSGYGGPAAFGGRDY